MFITCSPCRSTSPAGMTTTDQATARRTTSRVDLLADRGGQQLGVVEPRAPGRACRRAGCTAATTSGPAQAPRPASSAPATRPKPAAAQRAARSPQPGVPAHQGTRRSQRVGHGTATAYSAERAASSSRRRRRRSRAAGTHRDPDEQRAPCTARGCRRRRSPTACRSVAQRLDRPDDRRTPCRSRCPTGIVPWSASLTWARESADSSRWSPITHRWPVRHGHRSNGCSSDFGSAE